MITERTFFTFILSIRYDATEEFNVDSKAECVQLNLAHVARKEI